MKTMKKIKIYTTVVILMGLIGVSATVPVAPPVGEYVIIVNADIPIESLTKKQLSNYFLGDMTMFKNKAKAKPCCNASMRTFFNTELGMNISKFKEHWTKKVFSGYRVSPVKFDGDKELIEYVSRQKGRIGMISKAEAANIGTGCKIISIN
jgi:ABC-type phosphate transport system substrate-binding protein